jgi:hypothetical protein
VIEKEQDKGLLANGQTVIVLIQTDLENAAEKVAKVIRFFLDAKPG